MATALLRPSYYFLQSIFFNPSANLTFVSMTGQRDTHTTETINNEQAYLTGKIHCGFSETKHDG